MPFVWQYQKLTWVCLAKGCHFDVGDGSFRPPAGGVTISAFVWVSAGMGGNPPNGVVKILKNAKFTAGGVLVSGEAIGTGVGVAGTFPGSFVMSVPGVFDIAEQGDYYHACLYATSTGMVTVDGNDAHTWFAGAW
jgi:hypothetical protein